jgi:hypothetical protein
MRTNHWVMTSFLIASTCITFGTVGSDFETWRGAKAFRVKIKAIRPIY